MSFGKLLLVCRGLINLRRILYGHSYVTLPARRAIPGTQGQLWVLPRSKDLTLRRIVLVLILSDALV